MKLTHPNSTLASLRCPTGRVAGSLRKHLQTLLLKKVRVR
jgi:hypothetical protein